MIDFYGMQTSLDYFLCLEVSESRSLCVYIYILCVVLFFVVVVVFYWEFFWQKINFESDPFDL